MSSAEAPAGHLLVPSRFTFAANTSTLRRYRHTASCSGRVVANVRISITNVATGVSREVATNDEGFYSAPNLLPRTYEMKFLDLFGIGLGGALTPVLITFIMRHWGWRTAFYSCGALGILVALVWYFFADRPEQHPRVRGFP